MSNMPCDNMLGGGTHDLSFFSSCVVAKSIVRDDMRDRGGDARRFAPGSSSAGTPVLIMVY